MSWDLTPGEVYRRRQLHARLGGQGQGGISTPSRTPLVLIFTGDQGSQYGYEDGFHDDDLYHYTGEGQVGDMQMIRGNAAIKYHQRNGKELHLFMYVASGMVQYMGEGFYVDDYTRPAPDRNGVTRSAIVFKLAIDAPADGVPDPTPVYETSKPSKWNQPLSKLRDAAYVASTKTVPSKETKARVHYRSDAVKTYVLRRSEGFCEGCGVPAPFETEHGTPYLEPHHIRRRADAGPDHPQWVIALCPTCHARVHYGADGAAYNRTLGEIAHEIEAALPPLLRIAVA
jgi:5-methylcytosine-specific restriction enzyme A